MGIDLRSQSPFFKVISVHEFSVSTASLRVTFGCPFYGVKIHLSYAIAITALF